MITTILTIYFTGFVVLGTDKVCDTINNPPRRGISTGEAVVIDLIESAAWPAMLAFKLVKTTEGE